MINVAYFLPLLLAGCLLSACQKKETPDTKPVAVVSEPDFPDSPIVEIKTSDGVIRAELYKNKSPKTVANFLQYVEKKHFDNTIFHRVMKGFMIQGGGFEKTEGRLVEKAVLPPVVNEAALNGLGNKRGTLAMARTNDPHSATSQFFINTVDNNAKLNPGGVSAEGYTVFGKVLSGMEVADRIESTQTGKRNLTSRTPTGELLESPHEDVPLKDVLILSVTVVKP